MSPSLISLFAFAGTFFWQTALARGSSQLPLDLDLDLDPPAPSPPYTPLSGSVQCPIDGPMSCHNNTPIADDSCCFVYPGGRMLLTQFWDAEVHAGGSETDWTIHGLWYVHPHPFSSCLPPSSHLPLNNSVKKGPTSATAPTTPTAE